MTTARSIRARLWKPPNAKPDKGIDLGGKAIKAALAEDMRRKITENLQFFEEARLSRLIKRDKDKWRLRLNGHLPK